MQACRPKGGMSAGVGEVCGKGYSGGMVCRSRAEAHDASPPGMADRREAMP